MSSSRHPATPSSRLRGHAGNQSIKPSIKRPGASTRKRDGRPLHSHLKAVGRTGGAKGAMADGAHGVCVLPLRTMPVPWPGSPLSNLSLSAFVPAIRGLATGGRALDHSRASCRGQFHRSQTKLRGHFPQAHHVHSRIPSHHCSGAPPAEVRGQSQPSSEPHRNGNVSTAWAGWA